MSHRYQVEVLFEVELPESDMEKAAYQVVDTLLDRQVTPHLPEGVHWEMLEGCVGEIGEFGVGT